jgi:uncharacterized protein (TIGR00251 family)
VNDATARIDNRAIGIDRPPPLFASFATRGCHQVISATPDGIRIQVRVQPRAARTEIVGEQGGALKIRIAAPPVDGAANQALVRFLAEHLAVPRSAVVVSAGTAGRSKVVLVAGIGPSAAAARLGLLNFPPGGR